MTLQEFYHALDAHDWYYSMSESRATHDKGKARQDELQKIAKESWRHQSLYDRFFRWRWGHQARKPKFPD